MKLTTLKLTCCTLVIFLFFFACKNLEKEKGYISFKDGPSLALKEHGFYSESSFLNIKKDIFDDQKRIQISLNGDQFRPHELNIYLEESVWNEINMASGKYEVLFLKGVVFINSLEHNNQYSFKVKNEATDGLLNRLPKKYLSQDIKDVIGITLFGNHDAKIELRTGDDDAGGALL
ncbi:hypothetical protein Lbys_2214 [Leadbetterella byssophila DSM 17132]|uniref:Lipoprotein n=1 Tax=Leadbetterella byssophila (strain DSM 17132 / JCM 16389 / KACC 11308 / NBRC 106382 / 4M15) TaxID=649349 RepID=E4RV21_LEAB4|nr:hypothetical protein [Leadbetterella byssophila]ADQ17901.1 hypothetical protein Lbys_2214 [Leadbetterella byssophila DSM 17132]